MTVNLKPGIKFINFLAFIVLQFMVYLVLEMILGFVTFILKDPEYYNVDKDQLASDLGVINSWAEVAVIVQDLYMGFL